MAEYYNYNNQLKMFIPDRNNIQGRPKGWVWENGRVETSGSSSVLLPRAKLRAYVHVDNATSFLLNHYPQSGQLKVTLGWTVVGTFGPQDTNRVLTIPAGLSGDVILELENMSGVVGAAGTSSTYVNLKSATVVTSAPSVSAYAENATSYPGVPVSFFDNSTVANSTWLWDFGDGATSTTKNPTHAYSEIGEYTVTLTTNLGTKKVLVLITDPAPQLYPTASKTAGPAPLSVSFSAAGSFNVDCTLLSGVSSFVWNFGDGSAEVNSPAPSTKTFSAPGNYNVTVTATGYSGQTAQVTIPIAVRALVPPVVDFSSSPKGGLTVGFKDLSANNPTGWTWDFGENDKIVKNPVHTYQAPGTYNVKLTATNPDGSGNKTISIPVTVTAIPMPKADFTNTVPSSTAPLSIQFTDQTLGDPTAWLWNFGDGTISTEQNPLKSYQAAGVYTVFLTATVDGDQFSTQKTITVQAGTVTPPPSDTCTPSTVAVNSKATITLKGSGFKANAKVRIMKDAFRGIATVKSISSTQIVFEFFFSTEYLGDCGVMVIPTTGTSKIFENVITVS